MKSKEAILKQIEDEGVEFIRLQFTDLLGFLKNVAVTPSQLDRIMAGRFSFEGNALFSDTDVYGLDLYLKPDPDSFVILPWRPQTGKVAKLLCDVTKRDGSPFEMSTRKILSDVVASLKEKGYTALVDPECEFFLFHTDENGNPTTLTHENAGYMDVGPRDLGENARRDIVLNLEQMGYTVKSSHHEKAIGQHEVDFIGTDALHTADDIQTFKFAVRSIAKRCGLYATFMPMPLGGQPGSGMHLNISLYKQGKNVFASKDGAYSKNALAFMGGLMKHARGICAITNPTVNSYKRLRAGIEAPSYINWDIQGEKSLLKFHDRGEDSCVELRFPDPSTNPYLALAVCLRAGLAGMEEGLSAGKMAEVKPSMRLPEDLKEAIAYMEKDSIVKEVLGEELLEIYSRRKKSEWQSYMDHISDWERARYLVRI